MKYLLCFLLLMVCMVIPLKADSHSPESENVLLFIRDGSGDLDYTLRKEVGVMKQILEQSGYTVVLATLSGESLLTDSTSITPDLKLSAVSINEYSGLILPCMHAGASPAGVSPQAVRIVREAIAADIPTAVQHASVIIPARAGLLKGRKYAFHTEVNVTDFPDLKGAVYSGTGVVRDGWLITSGVCPYLSKLMGLEDCTQPLTLALIDAMKEKNQ